MNHFLIAIAKPIDGLIAVLVSVVRIVSLNLLDQRVELAAAQRYGYGPPCLLPSPE